MAVLSIKAIIKKKGYMKAYNMAMAALIAILSSIILLQLVAPIPINTNYHNAATQSITPNTTITAKRNDLDIERKNSSFFRTGLFKSAVALQGKPIADKTIERIKSQLKLQCIMTLNGQLVAYINIKEVGLKKCIVGDTVNDLFTVLNINETKKCVDISIIDHKVTLYM